MKYRNTSAMMTEAMFQSTQGAIPRGRHLLARAIEISDPDAREIVYGIPYKEWQAKHQREATPTQQAAFAAAAPKDH